jgi:hypothetical protein
MDHRMPWQAAALALTAVTACYFSTTKPAAPECEHAAPPPPAPAEIQVLIVGADGKITKTTMPAPTLVLSSSKMQVEPLFRSLDAAKALADGTEPLPVYPIDERWLVERPCREGAGCVSPGPPPPPPLLWFVFDPKSLERMLELHMERRPVHIVRKPGGRPLGPNGQPPEVVLPPKEK